MCGILFYIGARLLHNQQLPVFGQRPVFIDNGQFKLNDGIAGVNSTEKYAFALSV
jgi:hypothetical protein